jgi:hypothetical protein
MKLIVTKGRHCMECYENTNKLVRYKLRLLCKDCIVKEILKLFDEQVD